MLIELQKILSQELKCLCTKTTTVLSESMVTKNVDVCYIPIELERNILYRNVCVYTGHFIMLSMITVIYNKKTRGPTLMELFTATGKLKKFFFDN